MKKQSNFYAVRVLVQRIFGILLYFAGSRWVYGVRPITYFAMYLVFAAVSLAMVRGISSGTLSAREASMANTPSGDKILIALYWTFAYLVIYYIAGLESAVAPKTVGLVFGAGIALFVASFLLSLWAVRVNPFLESASRVPRDICQPVCRCGPYGVIRHPTYAAVLIWCAAVSMMFETMFTAICAGVIALIIIVRTALEDRMLIDGLSGYPEYAEQVKYRLIPFIW